MTSDQRAKIQSELQTLVALQAKSSLTLADIDKDLSNVSYGSYTVGELLEKTDRMVRQFSSAIEGPDWRSMPIICLYENQQHDVLNHLVTFRQHLQNNQLPRASQELQHLITHLMLLGLWTWSKTRAQHPDKTRILELQKMLEAAQVQYQQHIQSVSGARKQILDMVEEGQSDREDLSSLIEKIKGKYDQMEELFVNASKIEAAVGQIKTHAEQYTEEQRGHFEVLMEQFNSVKRDMDQATSLLQKTDEHHKVIESKKDKINELLGKAAAGAVGGAFEARRGSLAQAKVVWAIGMVFSVLGSGLWMWFAYTHIAMEQSNVWLALVQRLGLLVPVLFILGFVAAQYSRERSTEEEYAFRASVAMTMVPFGDELTSSSKTPDQIQLIKDTVSKLYASPVCLIEKDHGWGWFKTKPVIDAVKALTEAVHEIKRS